MTSLLPCSQRLTLQVLSHLNFGVLRLDHDKSISACAALAKYIPDTLHVPRVERKDSNIDVFFRQNLEIGNGTRITA